MDINTLFLDLVRNLLRYSYENSLFSNSSIEYMGQPLSDNNYRKVLEDVDVSTMKIFLQHSLQNVNMFNMASISKHQYRQRRHMCDIIISFIRIL